MKQIFKDTKKFVSIKKIACELVFKGGNQLFFIYIFAAVYL